MIPAVLIAKKRDGLELTDEEIRFFISGYSEGTIPDYQMAAWAMAVFGRGLTEREIDTLTIAMVESGDCLSPCSDRPRVDKHSTGGLGDKISLILAPLLACCEFDVPMISGRGLGITGGTLDKLESIAGFRTDLSPDEIANQVSQIGCVITGASERLVPADRKLYGLRDVTATVPTIPLITSSILSKKYAETLDALVLDVKWGSGAFMQSRSEAIELAQSLKRVGNNLGIRTQALLTDMNQPLGNMIGNACEVNEALEVLTNAGPKRTRELTIELAAWLVVMAGSDQSIDSARKTVSGHLASGAAYERFEKMVALQAGNLSGPLKLAKPHDLLAKHDGIVASLNGQLIGRSIIHMRGGRTISDETINHRVGVEMLISVGDTVERNQPIAKIFCDDQNHLHVAEQSLEAAVKISDETVTPPQLHETI